MAARSTRRHPRDRLAVLRVVVTPQGPPPALDGASVTSAVAGPVTGAVTGSAAASATASATDSTTDSTTGAEAVEPGPTNMADHGPTAAGLARTMGRRSSVETLTHDAPTGGGPVTGVPSGGGRNGARHAIGMPGGRLPVAVDAVRGASGRLVRRWLPAGAGRWRLDPGRRAAVVLTAVVLVGATVAGVAVWRSRPVPEPAPALAAVQVSGTASPSGELVVSVAGQVVHPGLLRLAPGARVADAVEAAGGPVPGADLTGLNLARRLNDGEQVVVGPAAPAAEQPAGEGPVSSRLDLNTATLADLDALPGIGPVTARRILDWRSAHGRFASVDQLREVDGIGEARFSQLRDLVTA